MWYKEALDLSLKDCFTFANEERISVESVCEYWTEVSLKSLQVAEWRLWNRLTILLQVVLKVSKKVNTKIVLIMK